MVLDENGKEIVANSIAYIMNDNTWGKAPSKAYMEAIKRN